MPDLLARLGVELPIVQAGMGGGLASHALAAVSTELRRTAKLGATFGPHTVTHRILSLAPDEDCQWEIQESYRRLRQETDAWVPVFCYPNGEPRA